MHLDTEALHSKLAALTQEHRELDAAISALMQESSYDQFRVSRMKKRKLLIKDMISRINSQLIPDLNA
ncbi:DUF465 domain-containing protein [Candidatus Thiothrix sp. Deng01]|uniref:DUF465 domain-containing protein n=2 Tax=Thiothrix TaxID=1030 RepID=A0A7L6AST2_9GAMM|nr:DUF465 domain-containing protein [Candidatus Thiothrix sp. Deng01]MEB4592085.1 DUF465 domain-containing protein [Candidatus Thiothrix sp. Deng01]QLQ32143.1 MAG: DUF465 domain-containing protein [Candidatus Thiothrix singaporensis]